MIIKMMHGDSRSILPPLGRVADLIVTSPPYADSRKDHYDSIRPDDFVDWFSSFHQTFYDVLKPEGSLVINIKDKVINGTRHRYVWKTIEKLQDLGWYAIDDYIWYKTNPMPGYWPTRLRDGWEYCFHLSKSKKPYMNQHAVKIPTGSWADQRLSKLGKNDNTRHNSINNSGFGRDISKWVEKKEVLPSNVLAIPLVGKNFGHPAVFPVGLPSFFINLLSPEGGLVVDPFGGSGTTSIAALQLNRSSVFVDSNLDYCIVAANRIQKEFENKKNRKNKTIHFTPSNFQVDNPEHQRYQDAPLFGLI